MTTKPHLPIPEDVFDRMVYDLAKAIDSGGLESAVNDLSDDHILIFIELDEALLSSDDPEALEARTNTRVWVRIMEQIRKELETR